MRAHDSRGGAEEQRRERRAAAVAPERQSVCQTLEHEQPRQRGQRPRSGLTDQSGELILAGEQNLLHTPAGGLRERDREPSDDQPITGSITTSAAVRDTNRWVSMPPRITMLVTNATTIASGIVHPN